MISQKRLKNKPLVDKNIYTFGAGMAEWYTRSTKDAVVQTLGVQVPLPAPEKVQSSEFKVQIMCAPNGALFYLLDCFVSLAMTVVLESLSLRASVAQRGNPVYFMLRAAHTLSKL